MPRLPHRIVMGLKRSNERACPTALSCLSPGISLDAKALAIQTGLSGPGNLLGDKLCIGVALPCKRRGRTILVGSTSVNASRLNGCICVMGSSGVMHCHRVDMKRLVKSDLHRIAAKLSPRRHCIAGTLVGMESKVGMGTING